MPHGQGGKCRESYEESYDCQVLQNLVLTRLGQEAANERSRGDSTCRPGLR